MNNNNKMDNYEPHIDQGFDEWYGIPRTTDESFWPSSAAAKAEGVEFTHIMEGRKDWRSDLGESWRNLLSTDESRWKR